MHPDSRLSAMYVTRQYTLSRVRYEACAFTHAHRLALVDDAVARNAADWWAPERPMWDRGVRR
jgi:hypothetical protein